MWLGSPGTGTMRASPKGAAAPGCKYAVDSSREALLHSRGQGPTCLCKTEGPLGSELPPTHSQKPLGFRFGKREKLPQICHLGK